MENVTPLPPQTPYEGRDSAVSRCACDAALVAAPVAALAGALVAALVH